MCCVICGDAPHQVYSPFQTPRSTHVYNSVLFTKFANLLTEVWGITGNLYAKAKWCSVYSTMDKGEGMKSTTEVAHVGPVTIGKWAINEMPTVLQPETEQWLVTGKK